MDVVTDEGAHLTRSSDGSGAVAGLLLSDKLSH